MALPEEELRENLTKLGQVSETLAAAWGKGARSQTARLLAEKNLTDILIKKGLVEKDAAAATAKRIIDEENAAAKAEQRNKAMADAFGKAINGAVGLATGSVAAQQAIYNASDVFQAVTPTLDLLGNAAKSVADALATATSGVPFLGGAVGAAAKAAAIYVDISTQIAQAQFENASKYIQTYNALSKSGVTFGGDLKAMQESAKDAGMSLDTYSKFVTANIENLAALGGGTQMAADRVMKMGKNIAVNDSKLFAMYGSYEDLNGAIAGYHAQLSRYGADLNNDRGQLSKNTREYLYNLKAVSELTGLSAEAQRKADDARSSWADYAMEMANLAKTGNDVKVKSTIDEMSKMLGPEFEKYAAEFIGRRGSIISLENQQTRAFSQVGARVADEVLNLAKNWTGDQESLRKAQYKIYQDNNAALMAEAAANKDIGSLARATKDESKKKFNDLSAGIIQGEKTRRDALNAAAKIKTDRDKEETLAAKDFVSAVNALQDYKIKMDDKTANNLGKLSDSAQVLLTVTDKLNKLFGTDSESFTTAIGKLVKALELIAGDASNAGKKTGPVAPGPDNKGATKNTFDQRRENFNRRQAIAGEAPVQDATRQRIKSSTGKEYSGNQAELLTDSLEIFNKNINIKRGGNDAALGAGKKYDSRLADYLNKWSADAAGGFGINRITGLNDDFHHKNDKTAGSRHKTGQAVDFTLNKNPTPDEGAALVEYLKKLGFRYARDEYNNKSSAATGDHIHAELKDGGITNGPSLAGEAGPEAVIPLPDGRTIPVKMDMGEMIDRLDQMIRILTDQHDTSEKILRASA